METTELVTALVVVVAVETPTLPPLALTDTTLMAWAVAFKTKYHPRRLLHNHG